MCRRVYKILCKLRIISKLDLKKIQIECISTQADSAT
jgi:hypothetical protein